MGNWPWPDDTKDDRYRRIIDHYRTQLLEADQARCLELDALMAKYGQGWISDNSVIDVSEMLTARQIAERFGISEWNVRDWARRHPEQIKTHKASNGRTFFRLGDVLGFQNRN